MKDDETTPVAAPVNPAAGDSRALLSVAVQFFVNGAVFASFVPRLPEIRDRIDISTGALGFVLALAGLLGLGGSVSVGPLISRWGTRRVLVIAAYLLCVSLAVIGVATVVPVLVLALAAMATLDVLVDSAMNLQGSWLSDRRDTPVMNRLHGLWSLGTVLGGLVAAQAAASGLPLRTHLWIVALLMFGVVTFVGRGLLRIDEQHDEGPTIGGPGNGSHRRILLGLALAGSCAIAMEMTSSDWAAFRLSDDFGASAGRAGLAYVAFTAGMTSGRFAGDWVVGRLGQEPMVRGAILIALPALVAVSFARNQWIVLVAYTIVGLSISTQFPKLYDDAARYPGRPGAGLGALTGGSKVALLLTPLIVGALAESGLSIGAATGVLTIPAALGFMILSVTPSR